MDNKWMREVEEVLTPLMTCSVEQRYEFFYRTEFGKKHFSSLNLQGSILSVALSVNDILRRCGGVEEFLREFRKLPKPAWYQEEK